jgi:hypothetical protein
VFRTSVIVTLYWQLRARQLPDAGQFRRKQPLEPTDMISLILILERLSKNDVWFSWSWSAVA